MKRNLFKIIACISSLSLYSMTSFKPKIVYFGEVMNKYEDELNVSPQKLVDRLQLAQKDSNDLMHPTIITRFQDGKIDYVGNVTALKPEDFAMIESKKYYFNVCSGFVFFNQKKEMVLAATLLLGSNNSKLFSANIAKIKSVLDQINS